MDWHSTTASSRNKSLNPILNRRRISPNNLRNLLPIIKEQDCRHSANAKLLCNVGHLVHVDLVELGLGVLGAELFDFGRDGSAGAAPFGPGV